MHVTLPALASFGIIARPKRLGGLVGFVLPVKARTGHVILGVEQSRCAAESSRHPSF